MPIQISLILCTHNPFVPVLAKCINAIRDLSISHELIEFIIVDNGSDNKFENQMDLNFPFRFKFVRESRLGLTNARITGIQESSGDLLVFVDDDNFLDSNYLKNVLSIHQSNKLLGCFGSSKILPDFEVLPANDLMNHIGYLALRDDDLGGVSEDVMDFFYPYGAGMVVKRDVAIAYVDDVRESELKLSLDRKGNLLNSCGDDHFSWIAIRMGYKKGIFPDLKLIHYIPGFRVQKQYLLKLAESFGYSRSLLFFVNGLDFPGLHEIHNSMIRSNNLGRIRLSLYRLKSHLLKMLFPKHVSVDEQFNKAKNDGVLRFYNQIYLNYLGS
ncbi:MAG: glycosyltransferase [Arcticibacter sp.]